MMLASLALSDIKHNQDWFAPSLDKDNLSWVVSCATLAVVYPGELAWIPLGFTIETPQPLVLAFYLSKFNVDAGIELVQPIIITGKTPLEIPIKNCGGNYFKMKVGNKLARFVVLGEVPDSIDFKVSA